MQNHSELLHKNSQELTYLSDYSEKDKKWDNHRAQAELVEKIYTLASNPLMTDVFGSYAHRMHKCAENLFFGWEDDKATGESKFKLKEAFFCRVRHCPVCQWRRSLMWQGRFLKAIPQIVEKHPTHRFIFLTLTIKNCDVSELKKTLQHMNASWRKLVKRKEFASYVDGWIRTTEVTKGADSQMASHPHFHAILMVKPSYFKKGYISKARWADLWQEALKVDYTPIVDVRTIRARKSAQKASGELLEGFCGKGSALAAAAAETLKYSVKPDDMVKHPAWFAEMTLQVHKMRFISTGGALKDVLREEEESNEELALLGEGGKEGEDDGSRIAFGFERYEKRYKKTGYTSKK